MRIIFGQPVCQSNEEQHLRYCNKNKRTCCQITVMVLTLLDFGKPDPICKVIKKKFFIALQQTTLQYKTILFIVGGLQHGSKLSLLFTNSLLKSFKNLLVNRNCDHSLELSQ